MSDRKIRAFSILVSLVVACACQTPGQVTYTKIVAYDGATRDHFGRSLAVDEDYVVIGALLDDDESGSAYMFRKEDDAWVFEAKLVAGDRTTGSRFGRSVAIHGEYIAVGAEKESTGDPNEGSVYIFQKSGTEWIQTAKLKPATLQTGDNFGASVALSADHLAIGAPRTNETGNNSGSVFLYELAGTEWVYHSTLTPGDPAAFDEFGYSCAMEGDDLLVGAWKKQNQQGAAYVFHWDGVSWFEEAKLVADDGSSGDHFGSWWLGISGGRAIIGALEDDDLGLNSGSAYIFSRGQTGWSQEAKLLPADGQAGDEFGVSASISGDLALVGSWKNSGTGAAYLFRNENGEWTQEMRLVPDDIQEDDDFGYALCLLGDLAVVGCDDDIVNGTRRGSAYILNGLTGGVQTLSARIWSDSEPVIIPPTGGTVPFSLSVTNNATEVQTVDIWVDMTLPGGTSRLIFGPRVKTIQPGSQVSTNKQVSILAGDPAGEYLVIVKAGSFGGSVTASDTLPVTKLPGSSAAVLRGGDVAGRSGIGLVYPNPFNPSAVINYALDADSRVSLMVFSADGEAVRTLVDQYEPAGQRSVIWDGTNALGHTVPGGVYFIRFLTPTMQGVQKIILLK